MDNYTQIQQQCSELITLLLAKNTLKPKDILVLGCSTSEIAGKSIGKDPQVKIGELIISTILSVLKPKQVFLAVQCCEHLNRCLVIEEECRKYYGLEMVAVKPIPTAGGSAAYAATQQMLNPVIVENIQAHAGIDIGDTLIGMHLKSVVVPVRTAIKQVGSAHINCAITRAKYIGGQRAKY